MGTTFKTSGEGLYVALTIALLVACGTNLMLVCSKDGPVRVGYRIGDDGVKVRVCRKCGAQL